jgi:hypothetical protein
MSRTVESEGTNNGSFDVINEASKRRTDGSADDMMGLGHWDLALLDHLNSSGLASGVR